MCGEGAEPVPDHGGPVIRRLRLAAELRRLRERARLQGDQVARRLGWSASKLSRIETGKAGVREQDVESLLNLYTVGEPHRSGILALARESAVASTSVDYATISGFQPGYDAFVYAEAEAIRLWNWEPQVVPGLLQTESYAREVMRGWYSMFNLPPSELELQVEARMNRQRVLTRNHALEFAAVIDESVMHRRFGDNTVMRQQIQRLADSSELPNVDLRVLPLDGAHSVGAGPFTYLQFSQEHEIPQHDMVFVEQIDNNYYAGEVIETNKYRVTFERMRIESLDPAESRALIDSVAQRIW
jgi:transcriptional regulator with XRE-family HTH domain